MKKYKTIEWLDASDGKIDEFHQEWDTAEEVAKLMELDPSEVEWAIEEYGRCDTARFTAWQPSEEAGIEYPTAEAPAIN